MEQEGLCVYMCRCVCFCSSRGILLVTTFTHAHTTYTYPLPPNTHAQLAERESMIRQREEELGVKSAGWDQGAQGKHPADAGDGRTGGGGGGHGRGRGRAAHL